MKCLGLDVDRYDFFPSTDEGEGKKNQRSFCWFFIFFFHSPSRRVCLLNVLKL